MTYRPRWKTNAAVKQLSYWSRRGPGDRGGGPAVSRNELPGEPMPRQAVTYLKTYAARAFDGGRRARTGRRASSSVADLPEVKSHAQPAIQPSSHVLTFFWAPGCLYFSYHYLQ
ncbi:unnamed protein product [[Candida] boidinii]|uniref:Unnamed protein product n=1 Tax=Candida boidinii TaxID=5477 RepID=A0A9W6WFA3_CANBO|nr:unnamed protein product [[Candida] boidinii]GMF70203.1 unnamed protein product [[Candida] boidinii]GMG18407.1 unnamed protein product [[Candida] boidinii]